MYLHFAKVRFQDFHQKHLTAFGFPTERNIFCSCELQVLILTYSLAWWRWPCYSATDVCVCVHVYIFICTCIHLSIYVYIYIYIIYMCLCMSIYVCIYMHGYVKFFISGIFQNLHIFKIKPALQFLCRTIWYTLIWLLVWEGKFRFGIQFGK